MYLNVRAVSRRTPTPSKRKPRLIWTRCEVSRPSFCFRCGRELNERGRKAMAAAQVRIADTIDHFYSDSSDAAMAGHAYKRAVEEIDTETTRELVNSSPSLSLVFAPSHTAPQGRTLPRDRARAHREAVQLLPRDQQCHLQTEQESSRLRRCTVQSQEASRQTERRHDKAAKGKIARFLSAPPLSLVTDHDMFVNRLKRSATMPRKSSRPSTRSSSPSCRSCSISESRTWIRASNPWSDFSVDSPRRVTRSSLGFRGASPEHTPHSFPDRIPP
jgi:hypothetical protein